MSCETEQKLNTGDMIVGEPGSPHSEKECASYPILAEVGEQMKWTRWSSRSSSQRHVFPDGLILYLYGENVKSYCFPLFWSLV